MPAASFSEAAGKMLAPFSLRATLSFGVIVPNVTVTVWLVSADVVLDVALSSFLSRYLWSIVVGVMRPAIVRSPCWRSATR